MLKAVTGTARVVLAGREVGMLTFRAGGSTFVYTDDLLGAGHHVLGQVFEDSPRLIRREQVGLPPWFANLLPEQGSGLRRYYAQLYGERVVDDARLLLSLGRDLPGAAVVEPVELPPKGVLIEPPEARVDGRGLHLSALAGAQPKMSVLRKGERFTLPAAGEGGDWIAKLPDTVVPGLIENEYLMMRWAALAGLQVPPVDLVPATRLPSLLDAPREDGRDAYVVRRFDRGQSGLRIHMEDLAQVTDRAPIQRDDGAVTYDAIGRLVHGLAGPHDFGEYLRRLVAMVLMGNNDAHLKNWSLLYPDGRTPRLSPAYDLVCTTVYGQLRNRMTFTLAGRTRADAVDADAFEVLATVAGFPPPDATALATETAISLRDAWADLRKEKLLPGLIAHLDDRLARHPLYN